MNYKLFEDKILVKPKEFKKITDSGLHVVSTYEESFPYEGVVLAVGPGKLSRKGVRMPVEVAVGDRVLFQRYGQELRAVDGQKLMFMESEKILSIVV
jgi:chaperonin GroES